MCVGLTVPALSEPDLTRSCRWCCSEFSAHWRPASTVHSTLSATPPPCTPDQTEEKGRTHTHAHTICHLERECQMSQKHALTLWHLTTRLHTDNWGKKFNSSLYKSLCRSHSSNRTLSNTVFLTSMYVCFFPQNQSPYSPTVHSDKNPSKCSHSPLLLDTVQLH